MSTNKKKSATCTLAPKVYQFNGKDTFLYSGEVHYFRIPKRYWRKHLQALVDAGCNGVSTYVPWSWHEFREGVTDLTGKTHPERDLAGFLDLAREVGLFATVKPGPYIMAETTDQGIPRWLADDYPEVLARHVNGDWWGPDFVSYASPVMREKAERWLRLFARKIVLPRQSLKRGAVIQMQLCNEIGMFQWLGARGDYSASNVAAWHRYLKQNFRTPDQLARLIDREVVDFEHVAPPHEFCQSRRDHVLYRLWHDYHRGLYADYVGWIARTLRSEGVAVPLFTNVGGWVYGRAHEFLLNGTFHRITAQENPDVFYGIDHIPEFVSSLNTHDGIVSTQVCDEIQRRNKPLYSAELQCGSREHGVQPYPAELGLFYRQSMIHGLTGMNFYMFSQGKNPKGRGIDGPMFYWYNAVDYQGHRQEVYPTIQCLGEWLKHNGDLLIHTKRPADLGLAFYPPMYETEFLFPKLQKKENADCGKLGIMDPVGFRDRAYFDGVIRILVKKNISYDLADITIRSARDLLRYRELVILPNEMMDAHTQHKLCEYVKLGGRLVVFPMLPKYDLDFRPCHVLTDFLGIKTDGRAPSRRIYMNRMKDIPVPNNPYLVEGKGTKVLARTADGDVVGVEKKVGRGSVRYFGFFVQYTIEEHPQLWSDMMEFPKIERNAWADTDDLQLEARFTGGEGILFAGNIHRAPARGHVKVRHPAKGNPIDLGELVLPSLTGLMIPLNTKLSSDVTLLFAHAELFARKATPRGARCQLRGPDHSAGRAAFVCRKAVKDVRVDGKPAAFKARGGVVHVEYVQTGDVQTVDVIC